MNLKKTAAVIIMGTIFSVQCIPSVSADNNTQGWKELNDQKYYFKTDGSAVTGYVKIGGIMYKFDDDGVCLGKVNGFVRSKGKIFYYTKGKTVNGWQKIKDSWYFMDTDGSVCTGNSVVYGKNLTFSSKGKWNGEVSDYCWQNIVLSAEKRLSADDYGYYSIDGNMLILQMKNTSAVEKYLSLWREKYPAIIVDEVKFSASELKTVKDHLDSNMRKYGLVSSYTDYNNNCIQVVTTKINTELQKYIDSLDDPSIISIEIGNIIEIDD